MTSTKWSNGRSNRPLTQFACDCLEDWLQGRANNFRKTKNNTTVDSVSGIHDYFKVYLWGEEIISLTGMHGKINSIRVSFGSFFDNDGCPSKTTKERLNGLLEQLGYYRLIPENVRVFKDRETGLNYLGKDKNRVAVGRDYARTLLVKPNADNFQVEITNMEMPSMAVTDLKASLQPKARSVKVIRHNQ